MVDSKIPKDGKLLGFQANLASVILTSAECYFPGRTGIGSVVLYGLTLDLNFEEEGGGGRKQIQKNCK